MNTGDELLFSAYRYAAGEMSADEAQRFELRLETDQAAREALAEAVELADLVFLAHQPDSVTAHGVADLFKSFVKIGRASQPRVQPVHAAAHVSGHCEAAPTAKAGAGNRMRWAAPVCWMSVGAAACLLFVYAVGAWLGREVPPANRPSADVARAWSEQDDYYLAMLSGPVNGEGASISTALWDGPAAEENLPESGLAESAGTPTTDETLNIPDWLLMGVQAGEGGASGQID